MTQYQSVDADSSAIIASGTVPRNAILSDAVIQEVRRNASGIDLSSASTLSLEPPMWQDFQFTAASSQGTALECETEQGKLIAFEWPERVKKQAPCGKHQVKISVYDPEGKVYFACNDIKVGPGDFAMWMLYILDPLRFNPLFIHDLCLLPTIQSIKRERIQIRQ